MGTGILCLKMVTPATLLYCACQKPWKGFLLSWLNIFNPSQPLLTCINLTLLSEFLFQNDFFTLQHEWKPFHNSYGKTNTGIWTRKTSENLFFFISQSKKRECMYFEVLVCHFLYINGNSSVSSATWLSPKMLHIDSIISVTESWSRKF